MQSPNERNLITIARGFGDMLNDVVFVGGSVSELYMDDPGAQRIRPTDDVDCIIEVHGRTQFSLTETKLRKRGFHHCLAPGAPICRWLFAGIPVDVMPTDPAILGFSNRWYSEGIKKPISYNLEPDVEILILTLPCFIATKIEAFRNRGENDCRTSHDIEDIILVFDGRKNFTEIFFGTCEISQFLSKEFTLLLKDPLFIESVFSHIDMGKSPSRSRYIIERLKQSLQESTRV